jgi:phosphohistidine phosphatase
VALLYVVRHAAAAPGNPDELRPLTENGRAQARALGDRLALDAGPDAVLTSPLLRARETAGLIARAAGVTPEVDDRLAPGATAKDVRAAVAGRGDVIVIVGHQPDCGRIAAELLDEPEPAFPPAGFCAIEMP